MKHFEVLGTRGFFRPVVHVTFEQGIEVVSQALKKARELGLQDIVVNTLGMTGFKSPMVFQRYAMATKLVESGGAALRIAVVARPEFIDSQKIGMIMMENRGGSGNVFTTEAEALAWLDARAAPRERPLAARDPGTE